MPNSKRRRTSRKNFPTADELLRFDAAQTAVPPEIARTPEKISGANPAAAGAAVVEKSVRRLSDEKFLATLYGFAHARRADFVGLARGGLFGGGDWKNFSRCLICIIGWP